MDHGDIKLLRSFIKTLDSLKASIDNNTDAVRKQYEPASNSDKPQPQPVIHSIISVPPAITSYYETRQREHPNNTRWERIKRCIEVIAFGAAITLSVFTYKTLRQVKRQADSAQTQAIIMQKQLEAAERPWVKLVEMKRPIINFIGPSFANKIFNRDGVFLNVTPVIKNIGRSPAVHVRINIVFVVRRWENGWGDFTGLRNQACESLSTAKDSATDIVLFPDEEPFDGMGHGSPGDIAPINISTQGATKYIAPALVGCIDYQFQSFPTHHQSGFVFEIFRTDNRSRIFVLGEDMWPNQITLTRDRQYDTAN